jgi:ketosteroid isomerase-like protein
MMMPELEEKKKLIESFYNAFRNLDANSMVRCYHEEIEFKDPAFGILKGKDAGDMWKMLCKKSKNLKIEYSILESAENIVKVNWEARYTFSKTGREVHNIIHAVFEFKDGKILKHNDQFNLHRWASQALGFRGKLIGGTGYFRTGLQKQTNKLLKHFQEMERS